jgi:hypothetical protein
MGRGQLADPAVAGEAEGDGSSSDTPVDGGAPDRPAGNRIARIVVVLLALAASVAAGAGAVNATKSGIPGNGSSKTVASRLLVTQMETVRGQLLAQVPAGSTVFLTIRTSHDWYQRVIEFATMGGIIVVPDAARADFTVSLMIGAGSPGRMRLVAQRTR